MRPQTVALAAGIAIIVGVASFVGILAGRITQRAPHGGGARLVVVAKDESTSPVAVDEVRRALAAMSGAVTVIPTRELEARRQVLRRKGQAGTVDEAAAALGAAGVVRVDDAAAQDVVAFAVASAKDAGVDEDTAKKALASWQPPTASPEAYRALLEGRYADAVAADPACDSCRAGLGTWDALKQVKGSPRLSEKERLVVAGKLASLAVDAESDPARRALLIEHLLDAYRKMTVDLPEEFEGHYNLGRTYHRLMNAHDESLHHLEAARRLVPTDLEITAEVADAWMHMADRKHAIQAVRGYLALFPDDAAAKKLLDDVTTGPLPQDATPGSGR